jgi:hypothetical protein
MPDFAKGKIYKIEVDGLTYYGSTAATLQERMYWHKSGYKKWKNGTDGKCACYELFDKYGFDNCQINLVENYPCETKKELLIREDWYIKSNECINEKSAYRTKEEVKEQKRQRHQDHKEKNNEYNRQYYQSNKEAISEKAKAKIVCECGREFRKSDIAVHRRSAFHLAHLNLTI